MQNKEKQLNILFEASILANGIHNNAYRSGIYVVAYNIFIEMLKYDNLSLSLYCQQEKYKDLQLFVNKYFPNNKFEILTDKPNDLISISYIKLKELRQKLKEKNSKWKVLLQLFLLPYSLVANLLELIYANTFNYDKFDIFFSPNEAIDSRFNRKQIKRFTFLHDTIPLLFPYITDKVNEKGGWFRKLTDSFSKEDYYFANSESTKNDFIKYYDKLDSNKVKTVLLACDEKFKQIDFDKITEVKEKYGISIDKKYVFSLCTLEPRKNLIRTVKTFIQFIKNNNIDDLVFVLGGGHWAKFINILEQEIENLGDYKDKIIKTGYIDDEDLPALYSGAEWFVYTSQYEGFGLPPLEAMSCGCPVITSNNSSLPEVVGDAGIMIDYDSDEQHIQAYERYYFDEELRKSNSQKGLNQSKKFSWEKCTKEIVEEFSSPQVSIVIPVYNNFELTKNCIDSINNANLKTNYEIIIADDGSTDETINIEKYFKNVKLVKTPYNMGFLLNVKNAIKHAQGDYIFLMNNDMVAKPKFLDYLYTTITSPKNIGVVGAMMLNEDDTIQEVGGTVYRDAVTEWNYTGKKRVNTSKLYNADYCSGCGIIFSKSDWNLLGGFDERFIPAYYEDVDLCYRIKYELNKRIVCCPKSQIYHLCGKTYSEKAHNLGQQNRQKFLDKWKDKLYKDKKIKKISHKHFYQYLFSIINDEGRRHKVITIGGFKIAIRRKV